MGLFSFLKSGDGKVNKTQNTNADQPDANRVKTNRELIEERYRRAEERRREIEEHMKWLEEFKRTMQKPKSHI